MALIKPTTIIGLIVLFYLTTFILFAILRFTTGVSIQRVGYLSLRHISFTPKEGFRIDVRGFGISIHRPTFTQPTWVSLKLEDLKITLDPVRLKSSTAKSQHGDQAGGSVPGGSAPASPTGTPAGGRSKLWKQLTDAKEKIKGVHKRIHWLRMLDYVAENTMLEIVGVGSIQMGLFSGAVHTRRKFLDQGRLFRHKKEPTGGQKPAEWIFVFKSIVLAIGDNEPVELLDALSINVHGLLYRDRIGLRDTSIAIKLGRLHIPIDDLLRFKARNNALSLGHQLDSPKIAPVPENSAPDSPHAPRGREETIIQTVADSKEFFSSVLRSVQEIQLAMTFVRVSKEISGLHQAKSPLVMNLVTHEVGFDLHQLDQNSPAHRMYFQRADVAHQALLAAISISVSLDDDDSNSNKVIYVPMATITIKTTLPSKTMDFTEERNVAERNANILFANLVVTSPAVDLSPRQLVQVLGLFKHRPRQHAPDEGDPRHHHFISRLLPKASIKLSIHEPVVRFVLPNTGRSFYKDEDYDMIISAVSSISFDVESSHSAGGDLLYSLASHFRLASHQLYYQAASGIKHNLMLIDSLELKAHLVASKELYVTINGNLRSFALLMVREEVSKGVYDIVRHFKSQVEPEKLEEPKQKSNTAFLRKVPPWLVELHLEGSDCSIEVAGIDRTISKETRGIALQLESWTADYLCQSTPSPQRSSSRRRPSMTLKPEDAVLQVRAPSPRNAPSKRQPQSPSDGRRLAVHVKGLDGFIIESTDSWESQPFLAIPQCEVAFSTSRDLQGPIFHLNSHVRAVYFEWSLYRFYSGGVAGMTWKDAFQGPPTAANASDTSHQAKTVATPQAPMVDQPHTHVTELLTIDLKASYIQVKADLPTEPHLLLQIYDIAGGRHRWSAPFVRAHLLRLHAEASHLSRVWARLVSMNAIRVDVRHGRKKVSTGFVDEKSFDLSTDFIRIAVPRGVTMYKVFDNIVNTKKAIEQLNHRFKTRSNEYILQKVPEGAKHVPKVSLRCKALMFELEDDPFEWKLGVIYHIGQAEQRQRIARAEAFRVKVKRLNDERNPRASSRTRAQSSRPASPSREADKPGRKSHSHERTPRKRSRSHGRKPGNHHGPLRYHREGVCSLTGNAKIQAHQAWEKLQEHNSRSWKKRIDATMLLQNKAIKDIRRLFSGADEPPHDTDEDEMIMSIPNRPGLMSLVVSDLHLVVDKPSFPISELPRFIHDVGKGMPLDMQYTLLIPMHMSIDMGEARVMLRDYPLSLLHIPAIRPGQPPRLPSWSLRMDFVIAEEFRDDESSRHVKIDIIPKGKHGADGVEVPGFAIDVRRTVAPVKNYSKPVIEINTSQATSFTWGNSYQPVIQDMMQILENFTKPAIDPSERVGFWDKIRLGFHSRTVIRWKGDGDVQLRLKGTRDPYVVTGYGAGFAMCWRGDTEWALHESDDPRKFMTVKSGEYLLAIPDYTHEARHSVVNRSHGDDDSSSTSSAKNATIFKKVIMKLSGQVQWTAGLVFERDQDDGKRSVDFKPHYEVILRNPKQSPQSLQKGYDAYRGFRSNHIHLSIAVSAPSDRDWTGTNPSAPKSHSYNAVHLSPRFFTHFWDWWHLFAGNMSLPIRQGPLWRGPEKPSKKFGRHLATIKYGLLLSPLFIAHVYKHKDMEDYQDDVVSATGLKLRMDSFVVDLHQRREYFDTMSKIRGEHMRTSSLKMNKAEIDFVSADLRAVAASIGGTTAEDLLRASDEILASYQDPAPAIDMSQFTIPDHDFSWIDMDDFVELDWVLPAESNPDTKILPLAYTPRFTYFRDTEHDGAIQGDTNRTSPFGNELSHFCVMSHQNNDPREVQMSLVRSRLADIEDQLSEHQRLINEHELRVVREGENDPRLKENHDCLSAQERELLTKRKFLQHGLRRLTGHHDPGEIAPNREASVSSTTDSGTNDSAPHVDMEELYNSPHEEFASDFNNRFIIHNVQLKWNNALRNIILRYSHQVSQRRGFVYYMSRRAVKFIIDIVEEQNKSAQGSKNGRMQRHMSTAPSIITPSDEKDDELAIQDRIDQLLKDAKRFVDADDPDTSSGPDQDQRPSTADIGENIAEDFLAMNAYHIRLIAPQIQLQSEKNTKAVVLVAAKGMNFKIVAIMDKARLSDDVSGLVQRRYALDMDGAQFFVTNQKLLARFLHLYSGNRYGNAPGSSWPPWVSLEVMFDFQLNPFGFQRVIQKTSAQLRYEKYNHLRLKYNEEIKSKDSETVSMPNQRKESRIDQLWVEFPRVRASCDSTQYYTMYLLVLDLLLFSEPLEKTRSERLEKIMLASDFSDLRGAPEMATNLQERIRQLEEIKLHFLLNAKFLDRDGWQDRIGLEKDLALCEDELFFIMKAITTSQQRIDERKSAESSGLLRWYLSASEIVWHLMREKDEPLVEFQLSNAAYERVENNDGSNSNAMEIESIQGLNLLPNAIYPDIIAPFEDPAHKGHHHSHAQRMLQVRWHMLEAIAGIPVLEDFEVRLHPLKVQFEKELGTKLMEYVFPQTGLKKGEKGDKNVSPFMIKQMEDQENADDEEAEAAENALNPDISRHSISEADLQSTAPGTIGRRLRPTYNLGHHQRHTSVSSPRPKGFSISSEHGLRFFKHSNSTTDSKTTLGMDPTRKASTTSLVSASRRDVSSSHTSLVNLSKSEAKKSGHSSKDKKSKHKKDKDDKPSDDLSQMVARASNYMTLAHVRMNSFVICLSYKGKGERNFEDLNSFVFRMPALEYSNKTWSNLDLVSHMKKDVIRALISHAGAIIGNKFTHHRPGKQAASRLRELAKGHALIANSDTLVNTPSTSETASLYSLQQNGDESPRLSFQSNPAAENGISSFQPTSIPRTHSFASSIASQSSSIAPNQSAPIPRPDTASSAFTSSSGVGLGIQHRQTTSSFDFASSTNSHHSNGNTFRPSPTTSSPSTNQSPQTPSQPHHRSLLKETWSLGRQITNEIGRARRSSHGGDGQKGEEGDVSDPEAHKKKSVLLLGKKFLGSLG